MSEFSVRFYDGKLVPIESVIEHAEKAAFATQALAVKLRDLDVACVAVDKAVAVKNRIHRECEQLLLEAANADGALRQRIR